MENVGICKIKNSNQELSLLCVDTKLNGKIYQFIAYNFYERESPILLWRLFNYKKPGCLPISHRKDQASTSPNSNKHTFWPKNTLTTLNPLFRYLDLSCVLFSSAAPTTVSWQTNDVCLEYPLPCCCFLTFVTVLQSYHYEAPQPCMPDCFAGSQLSKGTNADQLLL